MKKLIFLLAIISSQLVFPQKSEINWIGFEALDDSLKVQEKPVVVYFYTDWCVYCKKMDRHAFKDPEIVNELNKDFYAVKMNAETTEAIEFDGQVFVNKQAENKRNGIHQIPLLIASREDKQFSLPAVLVLDKDFRIRKRSFEYLTSERMKELIKG
ncbi:thioredoxin family protein [Christiangramia salexigens]|uniref:Thioredoxin family protein n=1 Tax=Christiangramia salexigens TaxID=1913577 RepID=A0A1L3J6X5_9FLAO|nr:thioredoxin family protein [Christiangramia salexigens]APG60878.1 thioredoxin family protein [Christiangramia salexigens]